MIPVYLKGINKVTKCFPKVEMDMSKLRDFAKLPDELRSLHKNKAKAEYFTKFDVPYTQKAQRSLESKITQHGGKVLQDDIVAFSERDMACTEEFFPVFRLVKVKLPNGTTTYSMYSKPASAKQSDALSELVVKEVHAKNGNIYNTHFGPNGFSTVVNDFKNNNVHSIASRNGTVARGDGLENTHSVLHPNLASISDTVLKAKT